MLYIILAAVIYSVAILFASFASRHGNSNLVAAIINAVSTVVPVLVVVPVLNAKTLASSRLAIIYAIIAGVLIALFTMAMGKAYQESKVAIVVPIVFSGVIFLSTILSYFFFQEKISKLQSFGLAALALGFILIIYARWTNS